MRPYYFLASLLLCIICNNGLYGQTTIASYDFESGTQGWSGGGWERTTSTSGGFDNGGNYMRLSDFNNYGDNQNYSIESPNINTSGYSNIHLYIDIRYNTEADWDGFYVRYSVNGGTSWNTLGSTDEGVNWYNDTDVDAIGNNADGWSGDNDDWETASINLPISASDISNLRIQVVFRSDYSQTDDGVAFDNVRIIGVDENLFSASDGSAPGGVSNNLSLWLKADQDVIEIDGDSYAWGDRSGNDNHAFQFDDSFKPEYITNALNGNPVVYFEEGPYMDGNAGFYTQQYFIVLDPNEIYNSSNAVGRIIGFQPGNFGSLSFGPSTIFSDTEIITHAIDGDGYRALQEDNVSNYGNPSLIVSQNNSRTSPDGQLIYNNGLEVTSMEVNTGDFTNLNNQGYRLGDVFSANVYSPFNGRIAELISYSETLTSEDRRNVETYLAIKYGITLDISIEDYTVNGNSIYSNTDFPRDIAGIGKNTATQGLNQTSSKSVNQGSIFRMSNPSSLDDGDYLVWGNDGGDMDWISTSVPAGNVDRLERTWYINETGNVGAVDVTINLNQLGIDIDNSTINLFQAPAGSSVPNTFSTAIAHTSGIRSTNSEGQVVLTFHGIDFNNGEYFTIGGDIQTTSPGGVKENLSMWFKADGGISLTGSSVKRWADYSGNANDVYQGNQTLMPTFVENEINFNPAVDFNNNYLDGIDGFYTQDYFVVIKADNIVNHTNNLGSVVGFESGQFSSLFLGPGTGALTNEVVSHGIRNADEYRSGFTSTAESYPSPLIINSKNNVGATAQEIYLNGIIKSNAQANTGTFQNIIDTEIRIGDSYSANAFDGKIAEVISYSSRLDDTKRRDVETYLAIKYGITLDISSQSYTAGGSNIYNHTGHPNNIMGIARDLDNGFNQSKSISVNTGAILEVSNGSSMGNGDYLVIGKDGGSNINVQTTEKPSEYDERIAAEYRVAVTGTPGTVTLKVYIGGVTNYSQRSQIANFYTLLISNNDNFNTVNGSVTASALVNDSLVFNNVSFTNGNRFTIAVPAIPEIGVNNTLWLRADKGVTTNGSEVTNWDDQSGDNNDASDAGIGPSFINNVINGNPAIDFSANRLEGSGGLYSREYFIVGDPSINYNRTSGIGYLLGYTNSNNYGLVLGGNFTGNLANEVLTHRRDGYYAGFTGNDSFSEPTIFNSRNNGDPQLLFSNGSALAMSYTGTFGNSTDQPYRIGSRYDGASPFNGTIAEVLSFSTSQSAAEKRNIETYLALKYGITLDAGSNYTISGTTVFNVNTFTGFTNNVIGLASNARYDFLQATSKSVNSGAVLTVSNPTTLDNNDFLVIGNDNGAMTETSSGTPVDIGDRVARKWAVQMTNTPGLVTLAFDLSGLGYSGKLVVDFSLILDTDSNFGNGISSVLTATSFSGDIVTFANVDLSSINYFGLGTSIDLEVDTDQDGIPNYFELAHGTDPDDGNDPVVGGSPYTDTNVNTGINGDGISDALEKILIDNGAVGPVTRYTDTDGDGVPDWIEVKLGTSPYDNNSPTVNGSLDGDGDGLPNGLEALVSSEGGSGNIDFTTDSDSDGITDFVEVINFTDPSDADSPVGLGGNDADGDGISDGLENILTAGGETGAIDKEIDWDSDGIPDFIEVITYTDPFNVSFPLIPTGLSIRTSTADFTVSGGTCTDISGYQWINVTDASGRLVYSINPVGNNLGSTCWGIRILNGVPAIRDDGNDYVLNRNWYINPSNQPTGEQVYIRFYSINQEVSDLYSKALTEGVTTAPDADTFNEQLIFTKISDRHDLDPVTPGGLRSVHIPNFLEFSSTGKIYTLGFNTFSSFAAHTTMDFSALPITLLYFKGSLTDKNEVLLEWVTEAEINNDYFEIERSVDGLSYHTIGSIKGAGNSSERIQYNHTDKEPIAGNSYYRIKQIDYNGVSEVFQPVLVKVPEGIFEGLSFFIYPNPAFASEQVINLQFQNLEKYKPVNVEVFNTIGNIIFSRTYNAEDMDNDGIEIKLDIFHSQGIYYIKVKQGENTLIKKVIIK